MGPGVGSAGTQPPFNSKPPALPGQHRLSRESKERGGLCRIWATCTGSASADCSACVFLAGREGGRRLTCSRLNCYSQGPRANRPAMTRNYYDQASRYAAKLDPPGFVRWVLRSAQVLFRRWLDTRRLPFPGEADRTCDTVAELEDPGEPGVLWAVPIEFTLEPDGDLGFRLLVYEGQIALDERPSARPGDRYRIGAGVVNLTGVSQTSLDMRLGAT